MHTIDQSCGQENPYAAAALSGSELLKSGENWRVTWYARVYPCEADQISRHAPVETVELARNMLVTGGIALLLDLLGGLGGTPYSSGSAYLYVGDGTTVAASGQSTLLGSSTAEAAMDAGYPQRALTTMTWQSTFGTGVANFRWEEFGLKNGSGAPSASVRLLNRRVAFLLEKSSFVSIVFGMTLTLV